jgi:hypothetical protein
MGHDALQGERPARPKLPTCHHVREPKLVLTSTRSRMGAFRHSPETETDAGARSTCSAYNRLPRRFRRASAAWKWSLARSGSPRGRSGRPSPSRALASPWGYGGAVLLVFSQPARLLHSRPVREHLRLGEASHRQPQGGGCQRASDGYGHTTPHGRTPDTRPVESGSGRSVLGFHRCISRPIGTRLRGFRLLTLQPVALSAVCSALCGVARSSFSSA